MRPVRQKWIARAAVAVFTCAVAASASGRTDSSAPLVTTTESGSLACPNHRCAIKIPSDSSASQLSVQAMERPSPKAPLARATPTDTGMLTWDKESKALTCTGYTARDDTTYQFFLHLYPKQSRLDNILYSLTYTGKNLGPGRAGLCLGARFKFTTASGAKLRSVTLPNGKSGFAGLLPLCSADQIGQPVACVVPNKPSDPDNVLKAQVPAIGGDPWVRS
jgi:hypothetical protein